MRQESKRYFSLKQLQEWFYKLQVKPPLKKKKKEQMIKNQKLQKSSFINSPIKS